MVNRPGGSSDPRRIRRLKAPLAVEVEASEAGLPVRLRLGGVWREVTLIRRPWRIDQHWWRTGPVRRTYYRVATEDSPPFTLFYDRVSERWSRQEYE